MAEIFSPLWPCLLSLWIQSNTLISVLFVCRLCAAGRRSGSRSSGRCGPGRGSSSSSSRRLVVRPVPVFEIGRSLERGGVQRRGIALGALVREHQPVPDRVDQVGVVGVGGQGVLVVEDVRVRVVDQGDRLGPVAPPSSDLLTSIALRRSRVSLNDRLMNHMSPFGRCRSTARSPAPNRSSPAVGRGPGSS